MIRINDKNIKILFKEYLLYTKSYEKSDRIYVSDVHIHDNKEFYSIIVRKCFTKKNYNSVRGLTCRNMNIDVRIFKQWVLMETRKEKILKLKNNIKKV